MERNVVRQCSETGPRDLRIACSIADVGDLRWSGRVVENISATRAPTIGLFATVRGRRQTPTLMFIAIFVKTLAARRLARTNWHRIPVPVHFADPEAGIGRP